MNEYTLRKRELRRAVNSYALRGQTLEQWLADRVAKASEQDRCIMREIAAERGKAAIFDRLVEEKTCK